MPDYAAIYDDVVAKNENYNQAQKSPGLRNVMMATERLSVLSGKSLDFGCGPGYVVEYLLNRTFELDPYGVDISELAVEKARKRLSDVHNIERRISAWDGTRLAFPNDTFSLVTSFDVLEHLDETDIDHAIQEMGRVTIEKGLLFCSVSCRRSKWDDINGENLHRTIKSVDWWLEKLDPFCAEYDGHRKQLTLWKRW